MGPHSDYHIYSRFCPWSQQKQTSYKPKHMLFGRHKPDCDIKQIIDNINGKVWRNKISRCEPGPKNRMDISHKPYTFKICKVYCYFGNKQDTFWITNIIHPILFSVFTICFMLWGGLGKQILKKHSSANIHDAENSNKNDKQGWIQHG